MHVRDVLMTAASEGSGLGYEAEASALFARMSSQPDATRKGHINTLIKALKTAGIWTKLDLLYLLAAHDAQASKLNWLSSSFGLTEAAQAPTFAVDRGWTGTGNSSYLDTGYTPSTQGVNLLQDDASLWGWCLAEAAMPANGSVGIVGSNGTPGLRCGTRNSGNQAAARVNDATTLQTGSTITDGRGFVGGQRRASTDKRLWLNGSQVASSATASTGLPAVTLHVCDANVTAGNPGQQVAVMACGASLADLEVSFYNAISAYLAAVGAA